jgi:hypothetical protein
VGSIGIGGHWAHLASPTLKKKTNKQKPISSKQKEAQLLMAIRKPNGKIYIYI